MKKRAILSLVIAAIVFAAIAFQLHKEAIAETQQTAIYLTIKSNDGDYHGEYTANLINMRTGQVELSLPNQKGGSNPAIHGGQGLFHENDFYKIWVCSTQNWGEMSPPFKIVDGQDLDILIETHYRCPRLTSTAE